MKPRTAYPNIGRRCTKCGAVAGTRCRTPSGRILPAAHAARRPAPPAPPAAGEVVLVRHGSAGSVLALVLDATTLTVRRWMDVGGRFAAAKTIPARDVIGRPDPGDCRLDRLRAAASATGGDR